VTGVQTCALPIYRTIEETLDLLWKIVSKLPKNEITKIKDKFVDQYYKGE
jgi:V/A-type H+-transporting ATPase subunit B